MQVGGFFLGLWGGWSGLYFSWCVGLVMIATLILLKMAICLVEFCAGCKLWVNVGVGLLGGFSYSAYWFFICFVFTLGCWVLFISIVVGILDIHCCMLVVLYVVWVLLCFACICALTCVSLHCALCYCSCAIRCVIGF